MNALPQAYARSHQSSHCWRSVLKHCHFQIRKVQPLLNLLNGPHTKLLPVLFHTANFGAMADADHGFSRSEMYQLELAGSVSYYQRHLFLCYKDPQSWPAQLEAAEDLLPRRFADALKLRKNDMPKTKLTICEELDKDDLAEGDVLVYPNMLKYRGLSNADIDVFVEEVLVNGRETTTHKSDKVTGTHVFVCSHANRDARCGLCGPILIDKFRKEIAAHGLNSDVSVRACSHVGGHKYAGNVIIFGPTAGGDVAGHWYGYVTPDDVPILLSEHIQRGEIVERLWRGQMGMHEDQQKEAWKANLTKQIGCCQEGNMRCICNEGLTESTKQVNAVADIKTMENDHRDESKTMGEDHQDESKILSHYLKIAEKQIRPIFIIVGAALAIILASKIYGRK